MTRHDALHRRDVVRLAMAGAAAGATGLQPAWGATVAGAWRFGSPMPIKTTYTAAMKRFSDEVARLSDGRITVDAYPAGQLGGLKEMLTAVQLGTQSMVLAVPAWFANFVKQMDVFALPYLASSEERLLQALDGPLGETMGRYTEAAGFKILAFWSSGGAHAIMNNVHPIRTPDDLRGLKMRVISSPVLLRTYRALGANPVVLDYPEVYLALQQHTIDGFEGAVSDMLAGKFYEVCKYLSLTNHAYDFYIVAINAGLWKRTPKDHQDLIMQAMHVATEWQRPAQRAATQQAVIEFARHAQVNEVTAEDRLKFIAATAPVYETVEKSVGKELVDQARAALS